MKFIAKGKHTTHTFEKYDDELYRHTMQTEYEEAPWEAPRYLTQDELFSKLEEMAERYTIVCER